MLRRPPLIHKAVLGIRKRRCDLDRCINIPVWPDAKDDRVPCLTNSSVQPIQVLQGNPLPDACRTSGPGSWDAGNQRDEQHAELRGVDCTSYGQSTTLGASLVTNHSQGIGGLTASTLYHYRVKSRDGSGNLQTSGDFTFSTTAVPDTTAPTPGNSGTITTSNIGSTGLTLNWTKTPDDITAQANIVYEVRQSSSANIATVANAEANGAVIRSYTADIATFNVTGLSAGTSYYFNVIAKDEARQQGGLYDEERDDWPKAKGRST